ncbi:MAG: T9SS type A sorting domain-containing protein [Bacteroidetes bacterium]|nr:T9SS type A sorting domain-containing protein [Bacteroidota bacterium]
MKNFLLILVLLLLPGFFFAQNLVQNPGFETATVGPPTGTPIPAYPMELDHWSAVTTDGEFINDPALAHSGDGFLSVLQNPGAHNEEPWLNGTGVSGSGYDRVGQVVGVSPATEYVLTFWIRGGTGIRYNYIEGDLYLQIEELSPMPEEILTVSVFADSSQWKEITYNFTTDEDADTVILLFSCKGEVGTDVWIDDVSLERVINSAADEVLALPDLKAFPNPASSELFLEAPFVLDQPLIQISGVDGRRYNLPVAIRERMVNVQTSDLAPGMYFVYLESGENRAKGKFVVR